MKSLLLIHPSTRLGAAGFAQSSAWHMPPLALGYVAALTPERWEIRIVDEYVELLDLNASADLVGITSYSANATRAYEISARFRQRGIPVVMGGIHVSMCPDEAQQYCDCVVIGEAESVWPAVIRDFDNGCLAKRYTGERLPMVNWPVPRRDLFSDKYEMAVIQTSRGCPFGCEFCSVTAFNGREYRQRPVAEILDELEAIPQGLVYFVDDNILGFGHGAEERAVQLFKGMIDRKIKKIWATQTSMNIADNEEVLRYAQKSGCRAFYIGIESLHVDNLRQMRKGVNLKIGPARFGEVIRRIHRHGIAVIGSFIVGHDHDDVSTFSRMVDFMDTCGPDVFQLSYLTPFPGTALFKRIARDGRNLYADFPNAWDYCDTDNIMIRPQNMSIVALAHGFDYVVRQRLNGKAIIRQFFKTLIDTRSLVAALLSYNLNKGSWESLNPEKEILQAAKVQSIS